MKKVLFTLATLLAFGFAANAEQAPDMGYRIGDDLVTEITLAPGASQEVDISIEKMYMTMVSGMQAQWRMYDVDHNNINYDVTNKVAPGKVYGSRVKNWFEAIEHGIGDADMGNGSMAIAVGMPYDNVYRIMATNANGNMCFFRYDLEDNEMFAQKIGHFTLVASADWDEEFATFELDLNYTTWNQCPEYDPTVFEEAKNTTPVILKVKNANFTPVQPDEVADPVITFAEENNVLTVTVSCATEGATLYVNGEQVTNPYSYTVEHTNIYEEQVVNVTAYAVNGTATSNTVTDSYTFAAQDYETLKGTLTIGDVDQATGQFVVTYNGDENVEITCEMTPVTSKATNKTFQLPGYGTYTVNAKATAVDAAYNGDFVEATRTLTWTQPQTAAPTVNVTETENGYLVTVTGEGTLTVYVDDNEVELDENGTYLIPYTNTPEGEEHTVTAYAQKEGEAISEPTNVDVQDPGQTPKPTITYEEVEGGVQVTATGYGHICLYVEDILVAEGEGTATYFIASTELEEEYGTSATAQEEGQRVSDYALKDVYVPAAEPETPTTVGQPTFQGYTLDGVTGYGVYIFPSTPADASIKYRVLVWDPVTEEWVVDKDWTDYTGAEKEIWFENNGEKVRVEAYAYVGENKSDVAAYEFTVETALNELMGGKTVAGVRYFNMAGQEMQEANGMTIVVTTYTDGTTSAVKVMK